MTHSFRVVRFFMVAKGHLSLWRYYMFSGARNPKIDVILAADLSLTSKSRSKVTKGHVEFMTLLYVFWDVEFKKQHRFDFWLFGDLRRPICKDLNSSVIKREKTY